MELLAACAGALCVLAIAFLCVCRKSRRLREEVRYLKELKRYLT